MLLEFIDLVVSVEGNTILNGINLKVSGGETHAIMGPNGTGKSTLASICMGHPKYKVESGDILLDGQSILDKSVDERSRLGIFLAMQNPIEVPGVTNFDFIKSALQTRMEKGNHLRVGKFILEYERVASELKMGKGLAHRFLNQGFSGGEKKRNEILQMKMLKPKFAFLDEIDSGLDVDALKLVGEQVTKQKSKDLGLVLITHYQRLLDYIEPDFVHIMIQGQIVKTGSKELIAKIDQDGYDWVKAELGIVDENKKPYSLGTCATKTMV
ncbi:Fe-S cluster assembly ATPase SufC [Hujiaoplasma nucleasis]|uniref:Fe-S cluster assembly ATPase SufC n=1 Tax=Hujiaoplasma nucleasis TaxID=2725268 RepID=A0A7L6N6E9_9MOLU|nr:Fe-S cluster assembly ATPase SufC [Hujiaoplasma nucleasis]QLY40074.1 Fe-S cluster assembly ATPase SufC [Hujiaoplasma nucleasis]